MDKVVRLGTSRSYGGRWYSTYAHIQFDGERLSITGVEGPTQSGNALGGCGQIVMDHARIERLAPGWTRGKLARFWDSWGAWHLNDMRAACPHQRELGWTYAEHHNHLSFKGHHCPICGYSIGSQWLTEPVPADVIAFLEGLPDTDRTPAWV